MENKQVTLNIGLMNNPYKFEELMAVIRGAYPNAEGREAVGEWDGADEPTAVIRLSVYEGEQMRPMVKLMCEMFTQTAIGMKEGGEGSLVYRSGHEGERYAFDEKYFIEYDEKTPSFEDFKDKVRDAVLDGLDSVVKRGWEDSDLMHLFPAVDAHAERLYERIYGK